MWWYWFKRGLIEVSHMWKWLIKLKYFEISLGCRRLLEPLTIVTRTLEMSEFFWNGVTFCVLEIQRDHLNYVQKGSGWGGWIVKVRGKSNKASLGGGKRKRGGSKVDWLWGYILVSLHLRAWLPHRNLMNLNLTETSVGACV